MARLPLEILQRVPLGPKQGIALVRVGERVVAVGVGDGGVRPLLELEGADRAALLSAPVPVAPSPFPALPRSSPEFHALLKRAIRSAALVAGVALAVGPGSPPLHAQMPIQADPAPAAARAVAASPVAQAAAESRAAQVDTMLTRLAPEIDLRVGDRDNGGLRLSGTVGVVVMLGLLTLLPTLLLMMTSFTRILIVLHFLRQALGTQSAPPGHLMTGLALLLTGFVMAPTLSEVNRTALEPWMAGQIEQAEMLSTGVKPFREFMLEQTRPGDIAVFADMSRTEIGGAADEVPLVVLLSAFVTSELKTAFQIGFALFLPFIIIDVVVASVLMSMGMFHAPAGHDLASVQAASFRAGGRLVTDHSRFGRELPMMEVEFTTPSHLDSRAMTPKLSLYRALSRLPRPRTYLGKFLLTAFLGVHVPLIAVVCYVTARSQQWEGALPILLVALAATLVGTLATMYVQGRLLAPVLETSRALNDYVEQKILPALPTGFSDEAGRLMKDAQGCVIHLADLLQLKKRSARNHVARCPVATDHHHVRQRHELGGVGRSLAGSSGAAGDERDHPLFGPSAARADERHDDARPGGFGQDPDRAGRGRGRRAGPWGGGERAATSGAEGAPAGVHPGDGR